MAENKISAALMKAADTALDAVIPQKTAENVMSFLKAKRVLPKVSKTERLALSAGTVGFDGEIINGNPDWKELFKYEAPKLRADEQAFLDGPVEKLCEMVDRWQVQQNRDLPPEAWDFIKKEGFLGLEIPKEHGGMGFTTRLHSAVVEKLASRSIDLAVSVMVPNSLGSAELVLKHGTDEQKEKLLPLLAKGEHLSAFGLTEPEAGSDATSVKSRGRIYRDEADGRLKAELNFDKRYITLAPVATLSGLAIVLEDPQNLTGGRVSGEEITTVLIDRTKPGVAAGMRHDPMGLAFLNGPMQGRNVVIDIEKDVIGGVHGLDQGWRFMTGSLAVGRAISLPSLSTGAGKMASAVVGAYSRIRQQFSASLDKFQAVKKPLGEMAASTYTMDAARKLTIEMVVGGEKPAVLSAMLKYHLTEGMGKTIKDAIYTQGGKAIMQGPNNLLQDFWKGFPVAATVEGHNWMTWGMIIGGQGLTLAHKHLSKLLNAGYQDDPKQGLKDLIIHGPLLGVQTGINAVRSAVYGLTGGFGSKLPKNVAPGVKDVDPSTKKYYRQLKRLSAAYNLLGGSSSMVLRDKLKLEENTSGRIGDVSSNIYLAAATLWRYEKEGRKPEHAPLVHAGVTEKIYAAEQALDDALRNHPSKLVKLTRPLIFPRKALRSALALGTAGAALAGAAPLVIGALAAATVVSTLVPSLLKKPSDKQLYKSADVILNDGPGRDGLIEGIYRPKKAYEPMAQIEQGLRNAPQAEAIEKVLKTAVRKGQLDATKDREKLVLQAVDRGILSGEQGAFMKAVEDNRQQVIAVNMFDPKEMANRKGHTHHNSCPSGL